MKKHVILPIVIVFALLFNTSAMAVTDYTRVTPQLSFNGTTATCTLTIHTDYEVNANLRLYHGTTCIASWPGSGEYLLVISGKCDVVKGETYTLIAYYTINGILTTSPAVTGTC